MKARAVTVLTVGFLSNTLFAQDWEFDMSVGAGLSDEPIDEYEYTDGTTKTLTAGQGLGFFIGKDVYTYKQIDLNLKAGFKWGSISDTNYSISTHFTYFPLFANARYNITPQISASGGLSYLLVPKAVQNNDGYKVTVKLNNSLGYNIEGRYEFTPVPNSPITLASFLRYTANKASYDTVSDNQGHSVDASKVPDKKINSLSVGLTLEF